MQNLESHPGKKETGGPSFSYHFILTDTKGDETLETSVLMYYFHPSRSLKAFKRITSQARKSSTVENKEARSES